MRLGREVGHVRLSSGTSQECGKIETMQTTDMTPAALQLAHFFSKKKQSRYDVTELDGIVPHLTGREIAEGLTELRRLRLLEIVRGVPTSARDVSPELARIDRVEILPALRELSLPR